jgi:hypothetical protein
MIAVDIFIAYFFFVAYAWVNYTRVFGPEKPFQPSIMQGSSILDPLESYKK